MESRRESNWWSGRVIKWAAEWCGRLRLSGTAASERKVEPRQQGRVSHRDFYFPPHSHSSSQDKLILLVAAGLGKRLYRKVTVDWSLVRLRAHSGSQLSFTPKTLNCHQAGCYWFQVWRHDIHELACTVNRNNTFFLMLSVELSVISEAFVVRNVELPF